MTGNMSNIKMCPLCGFPMDLCEKVGEEARKKKERDKRMQEADRHMESLLGIR